MKKTTKIKLGIVTGLTVLVVGAGVYEVNNWIHSYSIMKKQEIQTFDSIWNRIWDKKTKTFNDKLNQNVIQQLEKLAGTPPQKEKLTFAKSSVSLMTVRNNPSTIIQFVEAANAYYQAEHSDDKYPEQQQLNTDTIAKIEAIIGAINDNIGKISVEGDSVNFDKTITQEFALTPINTELPWKDKDVFNKHVNEINNLVKKQVKENNDKISQENIISLQGKLDEFVRLAKEYQSNIANNYISIKDLKTIISTISSIDVANHTNWFTYIEGYDNKGGSTSYYTQFSNQFFVDNPSMQKYQSYLSRASILVNLSRTVTNVNVKSEESDSQKFTIQTGTSVNQKDDDLLNIGGLQYIKITITQNQTIKVYKEPEKEKSKEKEDNSNNNKNSSDSNNNSSTSTTSSSDGKDNN